MNPFIQGSERYATPIAGDSMTPSSVAHPAFSRYLHALAEKPWPPEIGFGGSAPFRELPILELQRREGCSPRSFCWPHLEAGLTLVEERRDCQDFAMAALVRLVYRYDDTPLLNNAHRNRIHQTLLSAKYAPEDPGADHCCWHTENHQALYASAELLVGQRWPDERWGNDGRLGRWHYHRARERLYAWLEWRLRFGYSEWNSTCYGDEDGAALVNIAEFAQDPELRRLALAALHLLLFDIAAHTWRGRTAYSQGRAYARQQFRPAETAASVLWHLIAGSTPPRTELSLAGVALATSELSLSPVLAAVVADSRPETEIRERQSLDPETAPAYGIYPDRLRDLPFFLGAGLGHHPLVAPTRYAAADGRARWEGEFADFFFYQRCAREGREADPHGLPHALGAVNLYTYRTADFVASSAQDYRPGRPGYQQFIWCAAVGERAIVFTTNPAPPNVPYGRPGPWVGNAILPRVLQHRNVVVALHRVRPYPIFDQPPWYREDRVHAYFPQESFDEWTFANGWYCGRHGDGYVGLRPLRPARWVDPLPAFSREFGLTKPYELEVPETECAWICELGSRSQWGSFRAFADALAFASVQGDTDSVIYHSPTLGRVEAGWTSPLCINGQEVPTSNYPRYDTPWCQATFGSSKYDIAAGGHRLVIRLAPSPDS